ncbi:MAG: hypothetical protein H6744_12410 [Deltaproteobacteria bacterium]|nr:hypothetical protein [Deltaproteobacteria bacterium]
MDALQRQTDGSPTPTCGPVVRGGMLIESDADGTCLRHARRRDLRRIDGDCDGDRRDYARPTARSPHVAGGPRAAMA